jgi:hypothetical protein
LPPCRSRTHSTPALGALAVAAIAPRPGILARPHEPD